MLPRQALLVIDMSTYYRLGNKWLELGSDAMAKQRDNIVLATLRYAGTDYLPCIALASFFIWTRGSGHR